MLCVIFFNIVSTLMLPEKVGIVAAVITFCAWSYGMAIRVVEFSNGGNKLDFFLPKNQHTQRKLLDFEFWVNAELSKSAKI